MMYRDEYCCGKDFRHLQRAQSTAGCLYRAVTAWGGGGGGGMCYQTGQYDKHVFKRSYVM